MQRKVLARLVTLTFVALVLIVVGAGHSVSSVLFGGYAAEIEVSPVEASNQQNRPKSKGSPVVPSVTTASSKDDDKADQPEEVNAVVASQDAAHSGSGATPPPQPVGRNVKVWNFTHVKSAGYAVLKVGNVSIEPINPYLKKKSGGKWIGIHPSDLKIQPLLPKVSLDQNARLVYLDLGARMYPGSTGWFLKHYPRARDFNVVLFELLDLEHTYIAAKPYFKSFQYEKKAAWTHGNGVNIKGRRMARVADNVIVQRGDNREEWLSPSVDVAQYIMSNYTKEDFVALKLDIEGGEWTLIPHLIRTGAMDFVDELFLECHPIDFDDYTKEPNRLPTICIDFINDLRSLGIHTHRWF